MLNISVREATFYSVEVRQLSERQVVDFKRIIETDSFSAEHLNHIDECVMPNVEITWNSEHFNEPCKPAALLHFQLLLDLLKQLATRKIFIFNRFNLEHVAHTVHSGFVHLTVIVNNVVAHVVFDIQADYIARHSRHLNVDVDVELV